MKTAGLLVAVLLGAVTAQASDLDIVIGQFRDYFLVGDGISLRAFRDPVTNAAAQLQANGSWADLDYKSKEPSAWGPSRHLARTYAMVRAGGDWEPVHRALRFWREHDFQCPNWWHNNIGTPELLGTIGLLMEERLTPEERQYITDVAMPRAKIGMTGQNRVWLASNTLMCGLLLRDETMVEKAASVIASEVVVTEKEGIQPDFSFHQHGPQQQFGNYGMAFAIEIAKWSRILRGTRFALPAGQQEIFRRYLLDGERWVCWRGAMDISSCGRQLQPGAARRRAKMVAALVSDEPPVGNRMFWRSDYLVHRRPDLFATLKMCSKRVIGAESLNGENLSGYHAADGVMLLYRRGDEYEDIFPVWDWRKLPGVTCAQRDGPLPKFGSYWIASDFVGGVSDGTNGCAALDYRRDGVRARKAWFFHGDTIVCLGAGISGTNLTTTVNQCLSRGPVRARVDGREVTCADGVLESGKVEWVEHDGTRYAFPKAQRVVISNRRQTGNWSRVYHSAAAPREDVTTPVFCLWVDHGRSPTNASYAYAIQPAGEEVLVNNEQLQAVRFADGSVQAVFWEPGKLQNIEVDQPSVVMLNGRCFRVADPTQKLGELTVTLDGKPKRVTLAGGRSSEVKFP